MKKQLRYEQFRRRARGSISEDHRYVGPPPKNPSLGALEADEEYRFGEGGVLCVRIPKDEISRLSSQLQGE